MQISSKSACSSRVGCSTADLACFFSCSYVNRTTTPSLTYINDAGNAIIKVDNETEVPYNEKRNSVRITTTDLYSTGNLIVLDALHVPYGCSVWPA